MPLYYTIRHYTIYKAEAPEQGYYTIYTRTVLYYTIYTLKAQTSCEINRPALYYTENRRTPLCILSLMFYSLDVIKTPLYILYTALYYIYNQ